MFADLPAKTNGGEGFSGRAASSQRPEKYLSICIHEHLCPTIQCLITAYNEGKVKIQSKTEQKRDVVASFEIRWRSSWGRRVGEGWSTGQRGILVQSRNV